MDGPQPEDGGAGRLSEQAAYAALSQVVVGARPLDDTLATVARLASRVLPDQPEVSVTLLEQGVPRTPVATGAAARTLDERQYHDGSGPCLDACLSGQTITVSMTGSYALYPDLCEIALRLGVTHSLSVAMPVTSVTAGALNFYCTSEEALDADAQRVAGTFASFAGLVLAQSSPSVDPLDRASQLQAAVTSRARVEQARGILMAENHCSAAEAFELIVQLAHRNDITLRAAAELVIDGLRHRWE